MEDKIERIIGVCGSKMYRITGYFKSDNTSFIRYVKVDEYPEVDPISNDETASKLYRNHRIDGVQFQTFNTDGSLFDENYFIDGEYIQSKEHFLAKIESLKQQTFDETLLEILGEDDE